MQHKVRGVQQQSENHENETFINLYTLPNGEWCLCLNLSQCVHVFRFNYCTTRVYIINKYTTLLAVYTCTTQHATTVVFVFFLHVDPDF